MKMIDMGLAPLPTLSYSVDAPLSMGVTGFYEEDPITYVRKALASLTPEQRRKAVRKFRKLHRKARKKYYTGRENSYRGRKPSYVEKRRRMHDVFTLLTDELDSTHEE